LIHLDEPEPAHKKPHDSEHRTMSKVRKTKALFYTERPDQTSLVFAPPKVAEYNSAIHRALEAKTWGEFKAIIPVKEYKQLLQRLRGGQYDLESDDAHDADKHHTLPQSNEPFDPEFWFPGFSEGDYPDWLQQKQDLWLPPATLRHFARCDTSVLNGDFWIIDPTFEKDIVDELRREGFSVTRRGDLSFY
jgi:hypothetical protein